MKNSFYIFGAGKNGKELLKRLGGGKCLGFIDNDKNKQNTSIQGIECISLTEATQREAQKHIILISVGGGCEAIGKQLREHDFTRIFYVAEWLRKQMYFKPAVQTGTDYSFAMPFNHYESPYPDIITIHKNETELFDRSRQVLNIDFNLDRQFALIKEMEDKELPDWRGEKSSDESPLRYQYQNPWFRKGCADALCYMMQIVKPGQIIEAGSGYSTAAMLDTNEIYFNNQIKISSVEPNADRLRSLVKTTDNLEIFEKNLQEMPLDFFDVLEEGDILFVDSSHVSTMGSDVNYLLFEVLPRLKKGVYIHFHDMFYPFIYPSKWIYEGRAYNELYLLRAFLMNNHDYSIQLFGDMLEQKYNEKITDRLKGIGAGSLWIKKEH